LVLAEFLLQKSGLRAVSTWRRFVRGNDRTFPSAQVLSPLQFIEIAIKRTVEVRYIATPDSGGDRKARRA
jgi:hypothetical protein